MVLGTKGFRYSGGGTGKDGGCGEGDNICCVCFSGFDALMLVVKIGFVVGFFGDDSEHCG